MKTNWTMDPDIDHELITAKHALQTSENPNAWSFLVRTASCFFVFFAGGISAAAGRFMFLFSTGMGLGGVLPRPLPRPPLPLPRVCLPRALLEAAGFFLVSLMKFPMNFHLFLPHHLLLSSIPFGPDKQIKFYLNCRIQSTYALENWNQVWSQKIRVPCIHYRSLNLQEISIIIAIFLCSQFLKGFKGSLWQFDWFG